LARAFFSAGRRQWIAVEAGSFLGSLMGWFLILLFLVIGVPISAWAYGRYIDVLTGPWITDETSRHDH